MNRKEAAHMFRIGNLHKRMKVHWKECCLAAQELVKETEHTYFEPRDPNFQWWHDNISRINIVQAEETEVKEEEETPSSEGEEDKWKKYELSSAREQDKLNMRIY